MTIHSSGSNSFSISMRKFVICLIISVCMPYFLFASISNPRNYGAKGDGIADDTQAIQEALDKCGSVFLPTGKYRTTRKLVIHSNTVFYGEVGSIIFPEKDSFVIMNEHAQDANCDENITISNLEINAERVNAVSEYSAGLYLCDISNVKVINCLIKNIGGDGIYIGRSRESIDNSNVLVENSSFYNCGRSQSNPRQSIAVISGKGIVIRDCVMENNRKQAYAIDFEPNKPYEGGDITIRNCQIRGAGISCQGNKSAKKSVNIQGCIILAGDVNSFSIALNNCSGFVEDNTLEPSANANGIVLSNSPGISISGNKISGASAGIMLTEGSDRVIIKRNTIVDSKEGVYLFGSDDVEISRNTIDNISINGIYSRMESNNLIIKNNRIAASKFDVYSVQGRNHLIKRNTCNSESYNICVDDETCSIHSNKYKKKIVVNGKSMEGKNMKIK